MADRPSEDSPGTRQDLILLLLVAAAGLALRWWRLDLMNFGYDSAAAALRARETLVHGHPPLTGIVNSLGFRNPGAFVWLILPPFLVSPSPPFAAAWVGLLCLSGLWPLYRVGRRFLGPCAWLVPCVLYSFMPALVFQSRSIWAQNLMPALGAWSLLALFGAVVAPETNGETLRPRRAWAALAVVLLATGVHLSGAAYVIMVVAIVAAARAWRGHLRRGTLLGGGLCALLVVSLVPSAYDGYVYATGPRPEKPEHVRQFESLMPPPRNLPGRFQDAISGLFDDFSSLGASGGIDLQLGMGLTRAARALDTICVVLAMAGIGRGILLLMRRRGREPFCAVLLAWCFVPAALGAVFISRVNGSYFAPAVPAMLLLCGLALQPLSARGLPRGVVIGIVGGLACGYAVVFGGMMLRVDRSRDVRGVYYLTYVEIRGLTERVAREGVPAGNLVHLSGDWYQLAYTYVHREVLHSPPRMSADQPWAVIEDLPMRSRHAKRAALLGKNATWQRGPVVVAMFPDARAALAFQKAFWDLGLD